jgi:hypothetical protein
MSTTTPTAPDATGTQPAPHTLGRARRLPRWAPWAVFAGALAVVALLDAATGLDIAL